MPDAKRRLYLYLSLKVPMVFGNRINLVLKRFIGGIGGDLNTGVVKFIWPMGVKSSEVEAG